MSKAFPIGWCEVAGKAAGEAERNNYAVTPPSARRPSGWRPGTVFNPTRQNQSRGGEQGQKSARVEKSLDSALGKATEGSDE